MPKRITAERYSLICSHFKNQLLLSVSFAPTCYAKRIIKATIDSIIFTSLFNAFFSPSLKELQNLNKNYCGMPHQLPDAWSKLEKYITYATFDRHEIIQPTNQ